ncbi:peptide ABC transporter ATP-binding protein [Aeromicrobium sp. Root236]|uniref:ABC transporter ATP-binding protein n=1 Tax=Aeromicrobium sp. Root236 TaxID=1736498 RepID=UPI0006F3F5C6|nr:ABC transporter ATP-binding protein [Aeromicrobium sp. Root236]KRC65520.1 peptide ABC transporter ATP-binding protein [Aeromicrobium sp. Root236]
MTEETPTLVWDDVRITYAGGNVAVDGVSLEVERGGTVGLAGESGCGKSTLAMSVLRLLPRTARIEGRIVLQGEDVSDMTWGRLRAVRWTEAAIVFQGAMHSLNPVRQVRHQVAEALALHSTKEFPDSAARLRRVDELLALVDLTPAKGRAYPHELSGGQRQRVMIAMALACDPELIIADEPTTALDVVVQAQVLDVLNGLVRDRELTLVMISHDLAVLAAVCDRIVVMRNGRIVEQGNAQQILTAPTHEHTKELAAAFPIIGDPSSRLVVGSQAVHAEGAAPVTAEHAVLEVRDLVVDFRSRGQHVRAVDHVDLTCGSGEIVALVGQSGSGKTTLARTILGLQKPTSGHVLHEGKPLPHRRAALKAYRRQVQYVLQDPTASLNPKHTVYEAVAEGIRIHGLDDERERVIRALTRAELTPPERFFAAIPQELSGGQRQRVVIAGALALDPTYLVADEPVASLDASVRGEILALLLQLRRDLGLGALVITHDLGLAWNIADRVVVMHQGRIVENGPVEQVLLDPQHDYTKSLLVVVPSKLGLR